MCPLAGACSGYCDGLDRNRPGAPLAPGRFLPLKGNEMRYLLARVFGGYSEGRASAFLESADMLRRYHPSFVRLAEELENRAGMEQGWHGEKE